MPNRADDWYKQAQHDFELAVDIRRSKRHEWACFAAQQAAEKAVKALHLSLRQEAWLRELPGHITVPAELVEQAQVLDNFYIPTRYPDSHPEGAPFEHYGPLQSQEAIRYASAILAFVRLQMAQ
jgi:HEPN domain-containing protein